MATYKENWVADRDPWTSANRQDCSPQPAPQTVPQADIDEFYALLARAREYDQSMGQLDCELSSKKTRLIDLARELGAEIKFPK